MVLAAFAHDIRTPLTGILGLADLLATSGWAKRERRWIYALKDTAEHLAGIDPNLMGRRRAGRRRAVAAAS